MGLNLQDLLMGPGVGQFHRGLDRFGDSLGLPPGAFTGFGFDVPMNFMGAGGQNRMAGGEIPMGYAVLQGLGGKSFADGIGSGYGPGARLRRKGI